MHNRIGIFQHRFVGSWLHDVCFCPWNRGWPWWRIGWGRHRWPGGLAGAADGSYVPSSTDSDFADSRTLVVLAESLWNKAYKQLPRKPFPPQTTILFFAISQILRQGRYNLIEDCTRTSCPILELCFSECTIDDIACRRLGEIDFVTGISSCQIWSD